MNEYINKTMPNKGDSMKTVIVDDYLWTFKYDNIDNEIE